MIADLLSLQPPPSTGVAEAGAGGGATAASRAAARVEESRDARALRLAALPMWRLLDAPNAFQEAFACAVLVMEAAQAAGTRGQHQMRVRHPVVRCC